MVSCSSVWLATQSAIKYISHAPRHIGRFVRHGVRHTISRGALTKVMVCTTVTIGGILPPSPGMAPPSTDKPSKVLSPLPAISAKYLLQPTDFVGGGDVGNSEDSRHLPLAAFARTKIMLLDPADDPNVAADPRQNSSNGNKGGGDPDTPAPEPAGILIILPALFCLFFVHMSFQRKTKCHDFNAACDRSRSTD